MFYHCELWKTNVFVGEIMGGSQGGTIIGVVLRGGGEFYWLIVVEAPVMMALLPHLSFYPWPILTEIEDK